MTQSQSQILSRNISYESIDISPKLMGSFLRRLSFSLVALFWTSFVFVKLTIFFSEYVSDFLGVFINSEFGVASVIITTSIVIAMIPMLILYHFLSRVNFFKLSHPGL